MEILQDLPVFAVTLPFFTSVIADGISEPLPADSTLRTLEQCLQDKHQTCQQHAIVHRRILDLHHVLAEDL